MLSIGWKQLIVQGVLAIIFGIMALVWTGAMGLSLIIIWGVYALVDGIVQLVAAFGTKTSGGMRVLYIIGGIISILAGLIAVFRPVISGIALTWVLGIWLLVRAVMEIYAAFAVESGSDRWWRLFGGVLYGIAGFILIANPVEGLPAVVWTLGFLALFAGVFFLIAGFQARKAAKAVGA